MEKIQIDFSETKGKIKHMNSVNNGPFKSVRNFDNFEAYKAARIPYARNHDAAFNAGYGGEHTVDISAIFPNFDADPYSPDSYDFACTDSERRSAIISKGDADNYAFYKKQFEWIWDHARALSNEE